MYPISEELLNLFESNTMQHARITLGQTVITDADISEGGLSVNRYCTSSEKLEVGSVIAAEMSLILDNFEGTFDDISFNGQEMYLEVGSYDENDEEVKYMPIGYFTVDGSPRKLEKITIEALDRMMKFEKEINKNVLTFPYTVEGLLEEICDICDVDLGIDTSELLNADYNIPELPEYVSTYRELLSAIGEITGTCAFIDYNGELVLKWFTETDVTITPADRYSSDWFEAPLTITGTQVLDGSNIYAAGTEGYIITVQDNPLIQHDWQAIADSLNTALSGFTYTPFSATTKSMPYLYPLDIITYEDKDGNEMTTVITDWTFALTRNTELKGRGESVERMGYGISGGYTKQEASLINKLIENDDGALAFYELRNATAYNIGDSQNKQILYIKMASNKTTRIQVHVEINLESTASVDYTKAVCSYVINNDEALLHPTETYVDGKHVLHLMYIIAISENSIVYFRIFMKAEDGTIKINKGDIWLYASGLGIVGDGVWDGEITVFDDTAPFTIPIDGFEDVTDTLSVTTSSPAGATLTDTVSVLAVPEISVLNDATDTVRFTMHNTVFERLTENDEYSRALEDETGNDDADTRLTEEEVQ